MKRVFFLLGFIFFLNGCVASQDELQTLKIKVINLETTLIKQQENYQQLNEKFNEMDKKLTDLERRITKDVVLNLKTQVLSELEELKVSQTRLSQQVEDLISAKEDMSKNLVKRLEDLDTRLKSLELKIKGTESNETLSKPKPEEKLQFSENASSQTTSKLSANETFTVNATQVAKVSPAQPAKPLTEVELYNQAFDLYKQKNFDQALNLFKEYVQKYPKGTFITQSYYWMGEIYFSRKNYEDAILSFQKVIEGQAHPNLKASAMFKQALSFKALGDKDAYTILLRRIIKLFPNTKEAEQARALLKKK